MNTLRVVALLTINKNTCHWIELNFIHTLRELHLNYWQKSYLAVLA